MIRILTWLNLNFFKNFKNNSLNLFFPLQRYKNQGNEFHDQAPSDIVFIVNEQPHPVFQRKKTDLYTTVKLTLKEALLGFTKTIPHLDGHDIVLERSTVTQPGNRNYFPLAKSI